MEAGRDVTQRTGCNESSSDAPQLSDPEGHWWILVLFLYVQPVIAVVGLVSNSLVLAILPRRNVQVAQLARTFYMACAIGDQLIMLKIAAVFLTQAACFVRVAPVCTFFLSAELFWKLLMPLWLVGELLSGYSILLLNVERLLSTYFPHAARPFLVVRWNVLALAAIVSPMAVYVLAFGFYLYKAERKAELFPGVLIDTDKSDAHSVHFGIATKLLCFLVPVVGTAALTVAVFVKLVRHVRRRSRARTATSRSCFTASAAAAAEDCATAPAASASEVAIEDGGRATGAHYAGDPHSHSFVPPSLIAVVISTLNVCLYTPTLIFWLIFEFVDVPKNGGSCGNGGSSSSIVATILPLGAFFFSLTGIAHTTNFFIYLKFMYALSLSLSPLILLMCKQILRMANWHSQPTDHYLIFHL